MEAVSLQGTHWLIKQQLAQIVAAIEDGDYWVALPLAHLAEDMCKSLCADNHTRAACDLVRGIALVQYGKSYGGRAAQASGRRKIVKAYHTFITINHPAAWENAAVAALVLRQYGDALDLLDRAKRWCAENGDRHRHAELMQLRQEICEHLVNAPRIQAERLMP